MQYRKTLLRLVIFLCPAYGFAQTTYLPQDDAGQKFIERLEIQRGDDSVLNYSKIKPYSREAVIPYLYENIDPSTLSKADEYNLNQLFKNSIEWVPDGPSTYVSKKSIGPFFQTPSNLLEIHNEDFDLIINPVLQFQLGKENGYGERIYQNTRGARLRGRIAKKIGFEAYLTENQERDPLYVQAFENEHKAVPGAGYYKNFKTQGYDYFDARGYFTFGVTKYIDVTFGYDRRHIGNGYRSLFLSEFANNELFLELNTRIWKFNYHNLFMELNTAEPRGPDRLLPKKYATMHHLDMQVLPWLNVGLFEAVVFGRKDHFEFGYLNPVIFYRSIEQQNGSVDNALAGLDIKANFAHHFQFYGQLLLDEFKLSEVKANNGWWANKFAWQMGLKYIDAFGIPNLDLQIESNRVRPFTYSHGDSVANYTHYNQPMAHPLGANFQEWIGILRYQPFPKWTIEGKLFGYKQGLDINGESYGSNIFLPNVPPYRTNEYGYTTGGGNPATNIFLSLLLSYELRSNMFLEIYGQHRRFETNATPALNNTSTLVEAGFRWNMHRRKFEF